MARTHAPARKPLLRLFKALLRLHKGSINAGERVYGAYSERVYGGDSVREHEARRARARLHAIV